MYLYAFLNYAKKHILIFIYTCTTCAARYVKIKIVWPNIDSEYFRQLNGSHSNEFSRVYIYIYI